MTVDIDADKVGSVITWNLYSEPIIKMSFFVIKPHSGVCPESFDSVSTHPDVCWVGPSFRARSDDQGEELGQHDS